MPTYVIQTPSGRKVKIEATDEQTAMNGAMQWHDDVDAVVRTTYGEAANDPDSQAGVASVILNRAAGTGKAPRDVVMAEKQFEPWGNAKARARMEALDPGGPQYQAILDRVMPVINGEDPTGGATHFYAPTTQADMGRRPPRWDDGTGTDIGKHRFFKRPGEYGAPSDGPAVSVEVAGRPDLGRGEYTPPQRLTPPGGPPRPPVGAPRKPGIGAELAQDFKGGFADAWGAGEAALPNYYRSTLRGDMMAPVNLAGDVLTAASAPLAGAARAAAGQLSKLPTFDTSVLRNPFDAPRKLAQPEAKSALEGDIMTALSAARAPNKAPPRVKPMGAKELGAARTAAYKKVDSMGVRYTPDGYRQLVDSIEADALANSLDPDLHRGAASVIKTMRKRADAGQAPTLSDLDNLRKVVGRDAFGTPGDEFFGTRIRSAIDSFIDAADPSTLLNGDGRQAAQAIREARRLNTQYMKSQAVMDAMESAQRQAEATGSGGNVNNAIRQKIKPFVDPKSPQRIRNFTPDEAKAARRVVKGSPTQNLLRQVGKLSPTGNGLMGMLNLGATAMNPAMASVGVTGIAAKAAADAGTARNVKSLLDVIGTGGTRRPPTPPLIVRRDPVKLLSPRGAVGAGVTSSPLQRILADEEVRRRAKRARSKTRPK